MSDRPSLRVVVCAAIQHVNDGRIICGPRHHNCFWMAQGVNPECPPLVDQFDDEFWHQGFVDQWNKFMSREEAWVVAEAAGQIIRQCSEPGRLYSENLY